MPEASGHAQHLFATRHLAYPNGSSFVRSLPLWVSPLCKIDQRKVPGDRSIIAVLFCKIILSLDGWDDELRLVRILQGRCFGNRLDEDAQPNSVGGAQNT
jgi:hypothetical protein